jgi:hypothetical protein
MSCFSPALFPFFRARESRANSVCVARRRVWNFPVAFFFFLQCIDRFQGGESASHSRMHDRQDTLHGSFPVMSCVSRLSFLLFGANTTFGTVKTAYARIMSLFLESRRCMHSTTVRVGIVRVVSWSSPATRPDEVVFHPET